MATETYVERSNRLWKEARMCQCGCALSWHQSHTSGNTRNRGCESCRRNGKRCEGFVRGN